MHHDQAYFRALDIALELAAFVQHRPDAARHEIVRRFVFAILTAMTAEAERERGSGRKP